MTLTWTELRSSALVGTERRAVRPDALVDVVALPPDQDTEGRALVAAALFGTARRTAAAPIPTGRSPLTEPAASEPDRWAPPAATQLLELLLGNNLGRPAEAAPLLQHWFTECARRGRIVPDTLLVRVLTQGGTAPERRAPIRACLGERGRWLAAQRSTWDWAVGAPEPDQVELTSEALLEVGKDARIDALRTLRSADPERGRLLFEAVMDQLDASTRADLLACLSVGLGPDDGSLLETALDSRAKSVRATALRLLERLPDSARAARLQAVLAPLVDSSGRLRRSLTVERPELPSGDLARDLPAPAGGLTAETQWMRALVAGVGLPWWEATLGESPDKILARRLNPADDLLAGWARAAVAAGDVAWARALLPHTQAPGLWRLAGDDRAVQRLAVDRFAATENVVERTQLLHALPSPWPVDLATELIDVARRSKTPHQPIAAIEGAAESLPDDVLPQLDSWLQRVDRDKDQLLHRSLRSLVKYLSARSSITEAFA